MYRVLAIAFFYWSFTLGQDIQKCFPEYLAAAEEYHNMHCPLLLNGTNLGKYVRCLARSGFEFPRAAEECAIQYNNATLADMYYMLKATCGSSEVESATEVICCVITHELQGTVLIPEDKLLSSQQCITESRLS